ncbi:MAG: hypothetical protein ABH826_00505 [Patescibacteria group bacterium]
MKKVLLCGTVFMLSALLVNTAVAGTIGGIVEGAETVSEEAVKESVVAEPIAEDSCDGRSCALYCEHGSVPGSCGCQCLSAPPAEIKPQTSEQAIEEIQTEIVSMNLQGIGISLISTLDNVQKSLDKGNKDAAANQLQAFVNKIEAHRGKKICEKDADRLITFADSFFDVFFEVDVPENAIAIEAPDVVGVDGPDVIVIERIGQRRGSMGAIQNRLESTLTNPGSVSENLLKVATSEAGDNVGYLLRGVSKDELRKAVADGGPGLGPILDLEFIVVSTGKNGKYVDHDKLKSAIADRLHGIAKTLPKEKATVAAVYAEHELKAIAVYESGGWMKIHWFYEEDDEDIPEAKVREKLELAIEKIERASIISEEEPIGVDEIGIHGILVEEPIGVDEIGIHGILIEEPIGVDEIGIHGILVLVEDEDGNIEVIYLTAVPAKQGKRAVLDIDEPETTSVKSEVAYLKLKDKSMIEVQGFEHTITVPTHRQTGAVAGEPMDMDVKYVDARLVEVRSHKELALEPSDKPDLEQLQFRYRKISWEHKEQNTESEADWLEKSVAKKVVRFKAGSDLSKTVKSSVYESGGWMKIMKK